MQAEADEVTSSKEARQLAYYLFWNVRPPRADRCAGFCFSMTGPPCMGVVESPWQLAIYLFWNVQPPGADMCAGFLPGYECFLNPTVSEICGSWHVICSGMSDRPAPTAAPPS